MSNATYRLQVKPHDTTQWEDHHSQPVATESEAWDKLTAWERYSPRDRWRWVRG